MSISTPFSERKMTKRTERRLKMQIDNYYNVNCKFACCYNCRHSESKVQIFLTCKSGKAWEKPASVEPLGVCDFFEHKEGRK